MKMIRNCLSKGKECLMELVMSYKRKMKIVVKQRDLR